MIHPALVLTLSLGFWVWVFWGSGRCAVTVEDMSLERHGHRHRQVTGKHTLTYLQSTFYLIVGKERKYQGRSESLEGRTRQSSFMFL
jgi:hypothetical protein